MLNPPTEPDLFELFSGELAALAPIHVDPEPATPEPEPEPTIAPEPVKAPSRPAAPADDDHEGWVWWDVDRSHVPGTVTRLHFVNSGGRSKLLVRILDGTHKGMAPTINRRISADLTEDAHRYCKATYGARSKWPVHIHLTRPAAPAS